jgi:plastocyanin
MADYPIEVEVKRTLLFFLILFSALAQIEAQTNGTIRGKIVYGGSAPRPPLISMAKDPNCLKINAGKKIFDDTFMTGPGNSVQNVFVHLKSGLAQKSYPPPSQPVVLDQKGCTYAPRVQGAMVGQTLKIQNSDQTLHNIHSQSQEYLLNIAQPIAGMTYSLPLKTEAVMLIFKCQIHQWMLGYIGVLPHPFFSVSDTSGNYQLKNIPPGRYDVQAWHEQLGTLVQNVQVSPGQTVTLDFTFLPKNAAMDPGYRFEEINLGD